MKIQDIIFFITLIILIFKRKPSWFVIAGVIAILLSMPLFQMKVALFTAQRLVQYAASFYLASVIIYIKKGK